MSDDHKKYLSTHLISDREKVLRQVSDSIREGSAALAFGAGVSIPAKLPAWSGLISRMLGFAVQQEALKSESLLTDEREGMLRVSKLLIQGELELLSNVNPLESAEYVVQFFDESFCDPSITDEVRELAVKSMVKKLIDASLSPDEIIRKEYQRHTSPLLKSVCTALDTGTPTAQAITGLYPKIAKLNTLFSASYLMAREENPIHRAITYNYDPLIQEQLVSLYGLYPDIVITHPGKWSKRRATNEIELFHVHGFIAGTRHLEMGLDQIYPPESGRIVLSEDSYYVLEREEAYNWSSSVQSTFLNRYNCLFIGFSAEDFNFRRILRQIGQTPKNNRKHFLLLSVDKLIDATVSATNKAENGSVNVDSDSVLLVERLLRCREQYWARFGILPIFATRDEIPSLLCRL